MVTPVSADATYATGFEDGIAGEEYENDWLETKETLTGSSGWARCTDAASLNGEKSFGVNRAGAGSNAVKFEWLFNIADDHYLTQFETYIYWDLYRHDNYGTLSMTFVDERGNDFIRISTNNEPQADLTITYFVGTKEKRLGTVNQESWTKFGFEILTNNSIHYFLGDYTIIDNPYYVVDTRYPQLSRIEFTIWDDINRFYFDDVKIYTNLDPFSDPNGPYYGYQNDLLTFDGGNSSDLDGEIIEYLWDFGDGENGTGERTTHRYTQLGTYTVILTVQDDKGGAHSEETTAIIVESPSNEGTSGFEVFLLIASLLAVILLYEKRKR